MACVNFKHYCRVCKKGFMCGRALGGHMRAHGIGDESGGLDEEDNASEWEDKLDRSNTSRRMYQLRTNPNRLKSCRTCENCGKEFLSWKSFLEHGNGKCTSDESLLSSDEGGGGAWSKRKRSLRSKVITSSEEDDLLLATCLVQLANTAVDLDAASESSASPPKGQGRAKVAPRGLFECKACKKVFTSHQALGGHRASHKKVKGCFAAKQDHPDDASVVADFHFEQAQPPLVGAARRKSKVHECSICHRVFNSGQALGGHKRCHWIISNSPETSSIPKFQFQFQDSKPGPADVADRLDLNVPAWAHISGVRRDPRNPLSFDVSTDIHPSWMGGNATQKAKAEANHVEDEADSKLKLAKFSDLSDANVGSSQWLQVGIGSTTTTAATTAEAASAAAAGDA